MAADIFDRELEQGPANHVALSPLSFLKRSAKVYPDKVAVIHGERRITYAALAERCRRLAAALRGLGVGRGDTVAVLAPNVPALLEAHYGVPLTGAVLNALNTRLDAAGLAFILNHGEAKVLIVDREWGPVAREVLGLIGRPIHVVDIADPAVPDAPAVGPVEYEEFLAAAPDDGLWELPGDEWDAVALNYTSGTTGNPKGVVYHHRGAYLNALGNALSFGLTPDSVYLWTLPMFHCNGWTYPWAVTAVGGTHVCLRRVEAGAIYAAVADHGVTHLCAAPVVLTMLIHAPEPLRRSFPQKAHIATGGAAPPSAVIAAVEAAGFGITHLYGLTECYGPATVCAPQPGLEAMPADEKARFMARQGVNQITLEEVAVFDADGNPVPADGATIGELVLRGNTVMKGYLKNAKATAEALRGGWFRTGDLGVVHPDGYVEVKDRSKDIIISGGENISSLEVEEALYRHPAVLEAAVVARPDEKWGETPCAFVTLKPGAAATEAEIIAHCRQTIAHYKVPRTIIFRELPKTSTGKIQKTMLRDAAKEI